MSVAGATIAGMTSWSDVAAAAPELAGTVRRTFAIRKHATMATTSLDGTPRISGTEVDFADDGEIYLGMMAGARRTADLRRDPRVAVHCPTEDPPEDEPSRWLGDGKITARAIDMPGKAPEGADMFRLDITRVVHTTVAGDTLVVTSWTPERGIRVARRS